MAQTRTPEGPALGLPMEVFDGIRADIL